MRRHLLAPSLALLGAAPALAQWQETSKLIASDGVFDDQLGRAVATDGVLAAVGGPYAFVAKNESGAVWVYDVATGAELRKLFPLAGGKKDHFGYAIGLHGTHAVVAAPGYGAERGAVYVFDMVTGAELQILTASDAQDGDDFGFSLDVDADADLLLVGAPHADPVTLTGAAYLFDLATGTEILKLLPPTTQQYQWFGTDVAIEGDRAVVGAAAADAPLMDSGIAYVYDLTTGALVHELVAPDAGQSDQFGAAVELSAGRVVVGAPYHDLSPSNDSEGAVYVFDLATGALLDELVPLGQPAHAWFGRSLSLDGSLAAIGAPRVDSRGGAFLWDLERGEQLAKVTSSDLAIDDYFGYAVSLAGPRLLVGARADDPWGTGSGSAYLFEALDCVWSRDCTPAVPNSTGLPGEIDVLSCSASQGALLLGRDLPYDQFGYLLVGTGSAVSTPPGSSGKLCLGGAAIGRYSSDVASTGAAGKISTDLVFGATGAGTGKLPTPPGGALAAGQTWRFQYWCRDAGGTSNFTDVAVVTFQP